MATATANTVIGAGTVSIGDYVAAGGAGSLTDVGHTNSPVVLGIAHEDHDTISERAVGVIKKTPINMNVTLKVAMLEATLEHHRILTRQASANLTGVPPDLTLRIGLPAEQYHQITVVSAGLGTGKVRTVTLWRCIPTDVGDIMAAKGEDVVFDVTFQVLFDDSVTTLDKFGKVVDS